MAGFFGLLLFLSFVLLIVGLIIPKRIKFLPEKFRSRGKIAGISILGMIIFFIGIAITSPTNTTKTETANKQTATETAKKDTPKKEEQKAEKKPEDEAWNKSVMDATKNGNMKIAAKLVKQDSNLAARAIDGEPAEIIKRPWDSYGKVIKFTGKITVLSDFPPDNDITKALGGGDACEIVMTNGSTIIDGMYKGTTKGLQEGQTITTYAYPAGVTEVPNKLGGKFTQLIVVGVLNQ